METIAVLSVIVFIIVIWLIRDNSIKSFKIWYYEQKFKYHKEKFTKEEWDNIEKIMNQ